MQAFLRRQGHKWACVSPEFLSRIVPKPLHSLAAHQQQHSCSCSSASGAALGIAPETDVETAVSMVMTAIGRKAGAVEAQLAQRLRDNLYYTARDVAAMSPEELDVLHVPVKLWAALKEEIRTPHLRQRKLSQDSSTIADVCNNYGQDQHTVQPQLMPAATVDPLPADIMQRRLPVRVVQRQLAEQNIRVRHTQLRSQQPYGLQEQDLMPILHEELAALERFSTTRWYGQLVEPLRPVTFRSVTKHYALLLLGYAHRVKGIPLNELSLKTLVPSPGREGVTLLMAYQRWRQEERGTAASTATNSIKAATHIARFLYHDLAKPVVQGKRAYHDLEVIQELNAMQRTASKQAAGASKVADESKKWLEWNDYLTLVQKLRAECAGLTSTGKPRSRKEVATSLQRYLIVAILSVVPDRQRTLRELEVGKTLLHREDGTWIIKHGASDYKTGKQYGDRPIMLIAPFIYPELEAFIRTWRQELNPKTSMLFCSPESGDPLNEKKLYYMFKSAAIRLTGKATHPHLVRDMIVTHLKMQKTSESEMEALAVYMGHSIGMQRSTYDRRSKAQKVTPAVELLQGLWRN